NGLIGFQLHGLSEAAAPDDRPRRVSNFPVGDEQVVATPRYEAQGHDEGNDVAHAISLGWEFSTVAELH
ncbi:hypothetical protein KBZ21_55035, partial [Streptomyces sp. A73]|nr:hypothetical protein [Streptomyces sp. A73]